MNIEQEKPSRQVVRLSKRLPVLIALAAAILVLTTVSLGAFGVSNFGSIHIADTNLTATPVLMVNSTGSGNIFEVQDAGTPVAQIYDGGQMVMGAVFDVNGNELTLDADADTSITASTDDQIDIEIAGADDFVFTANLFESQTGSVIDLNGTKLELDADADTSITVDTDDQIDFEIAGADEVVLTAAQLDMNNTLINQDLGTENIGQQLTIVTQAITWTAAAGGTGTLATVGDGEIWLVHSVFINVTTNFDATGDDVTFVIGDGNDANGLLDVVDAELQTTFTEATGYAAGWFGIEAGSGGAYTLDDGGPFVYAPSGADETIDWTIDETSGETITAGALTAYIIYTRIQ